MGPFFMLHEQFCPPDHAAQPGERYRDAKGSGLHRVCVFATQRLLSRSLNLQA
jgi:hypothetical protein